MLEKLTYLLPAYLIYGAVSILGIWISRIRRKLIARSIILPGEFKVFDHLLTSLIFAPMGEELLFRGPLIIAFSSVTDNAWVGIVISALLFSIGHYLPFPVVSNIEGTLYMPNSNLMEDFKGVIRILNSAFVFLLGIISGYFCIRYQSLHIGIAIHSLWNLAFEQVFPAIFYAIAIILAYYLTDRAVRYGEQKLRGVLKH